MTKRSVEVGYSEFDDAHDEWLGWTYRDICRGKRLEEGFNRPPPENPIVISVLVDWVLEEKDWCQAEGEFRDLLQELGFDTTEVKIEFEHGNEVWTSD